MLLNTNTLGQADTCYKAKKLINDNQDLLIHSCDYILRFSKEKFFGLKKTVDGTGRTIATQEHTLVGGSENLTLSDYDTYFSSFP